MRQTSIKTENGGSGNSRGAKWARIIAVTSLLLAPMAALANPAAAGEKTKVNDAAPKRVLIVSIPDRRLALLVDGRVVKTYKVAVGERRTPTPVGRFQIVNRIENPTYYHKGTVIRSGRTNPLGNRWMGLDVKGYGIHGTNAPRSIGHAASHGCIRMRRQDVEDLFSRVRVGDIVEIQWRPSTALDAIFNSGREAGSEVKSAARVKPAGSDAVIAAAASEF